VQNRQRARVGDYSGEQADVVISQGAQAACGGLPGSEVPVLAAGDDVWGASPGEQFRLVSVAVGERPVAVLISADWTQTPSVQEIASMLNVGQRVLDTVKF
jgi:hypothetical protein